MQNTIKQITSLIDKKEEKPKQEHQMFNTLEDAINQALHEAFMKKIKEEKK